MKVVKRDGRTVEYDRNKIILAIKKANHDVCELERVTDKQIDKIVKYIEDLQKKRILVEDIQNIIEVELMKMKKYELAKAYIIYRYNRALIRKSNSTDESILNLIKNSSKNIIGNNKKNHIIASTQRDIIAGEVSRDLTKRILLPEKISKAHEDGVLYFHDDDYFLQPMINSSIVNYGDMFENGTVMNNKMIEVPKSFQVSCTVLTQIIAAVASSQYGGQSININHLGKYLKYTEDKFRKNLESKYKDSIDKELIDSIVKDRLLEELSGGVQTIQYQINTLMTTNGKSPIVTLFLYLDEKDKYLEYSAMIIEEILSQRYKGIKDSSGELITPNIPKLVYVIDSNNNLSGNKYDYITELAIKCSIKGLNIDYMSAKVMKENYNCVFSPIGNKEFLCNYKNIYEGRFNQGIVTINLPQIALIANKNKDLFFSMLDERLNLCFEALMCRHRALLGTVSDVSPIHWQNGAVSRLKTNETIDQYLKSKYSTLSLEYIGLYETVKCMTGYSLSNDDGMSFGMEIMDKLNDAINTWTKETGLGFVLAGSTNYEVSKRFITIDSENYDEIKDINDKDHYSFSFHLDSKEKMDIYKKLDIESKFQKYSLGGCSCLIELSNNNVKNLEKMIKYIYENIQYVEFVSKENK